MSKINTNTLMKRLFRAPDLDSYLQGNEGQMAVPEFRELLQEYSSRRNLISARVIEQAQIERTYGHQLFNGTRRPSRDKVLQLALGLGLNVEETQRLLRSAEKSPLYPRLRRDAVILYGIQKHLSVLEVQEHLTRYGLTLLGGQKDGI